FSSPDVDYGLGLIHSMKGAVVTFESARGARFDLRIPAEKIDRSAKPGESWQELSPLQPTGRPSWAAALRLAPGLPLYLRHPEKAYWFDYEPRSRLLYFQFNRAGNDEAGPS